MQFTALLLFAAQTATVSDVSFRTDRDVTIQVQPGTVLDASEQGTLSATLSFFSDLQDVDGEYHALDVRFAWKMSTLDGIDGEFNVPGCPWLGLDSTVEARLLSVDGDTGEVQVRVDVPIGGGGAQGRAKYPTIPDSGGVLTIEGGWVGSFGSTTDCQPLNSLFAAEIDLFAQMPDVWIERMTRPERSTVAAGNLHFVLSTRSSAAHDRSFALSVQPSGVVELSSESAALPADDWHVSFHATPLRPGSFRVLATGPDGAEWTSPLFHVRRGIQIAQEGGGDGGGGGEQGGSEGGGEEEESKLLHDCSPAVPIPPGPNDKYEHCYDCVAAPNQPLEECLGVNGETVNLCKPGHCFFDPTTTTGCTPKAETVPSESWTLLSSKINKCGSKGGGFSIAWGLISFGGEGSTPYNARCCVWKADPQGGSEMPCKSCE